MAHPRVFREHQICFGHRLDTRTGDGLEAERFCRMGDAPYQVRGAFLPRDQNSAFPGVRAKGITSRMFETPVRNISKRSNPRPKPACGTVPYFRRSAYHQ